MRQDLPDDKPLWISLAKRLGLWTEEYEQLFVSGVPKQETDETTPKPSGSWRSLRQESFFMFDCGIRPNQVARRMGMKSATAYRYFQQWKNMSPLFWAKYKTARTCYRRCGSTERRQIARVLANELAASEKEILARMKKPWALKQIINGEWKQWSLKSAGARPKRRFRRALGFLRSLTYSSDVEYITELALNPDLTYDDIFHDDD